MKGDLIDIQRLFDPHLGYNNHPELQVKVFKKLLSDNLKTEQKESIIILLKSIHCMRLLKDCINVSKKYISHEWFYEIENYIDVECINCKYCG